MNPSEDLQMRIERVLRTCDQIPSDLPIVRYREKDKQSQMEVAIAARRGLCLIIPMPVPTSAMQGADVVFFDGFEVRVQIVQIPNVSRDYPVDLYDLIYIVPDALHWQPKTVDSPLWGILAHPLYLAQRPLEMAQGVVAVPGFEHNGEVIMGADLIFGAALQPPQS